MAISLALFLVAVGLAALATSLGSALERERDTHEDLRVATARFVTALLTYDYKDLEASKAAVLAMTSPSLRAKYDQQFPLLADTVTKNQARAAARVTRIYIGPNDEDAATVIAVADAAAETKRGSTATVESFFQLQLVRIEGRWLVDEVTNVKVGESPPSSLPPTTPTTRR